MHWVFLEHDITKRELLIDLKNTFQDDTFSFITDKESIGIPVQLITNKSYLKKHIELTIHDEEKGFRYLDILAEYLSEKYNCDTVRELPTQIAIKEFNDEFAIQVYSVLYRNGRKYIISDDGIEAEEFEVRIIKELNN